jgi:Protein of unknown function (DUF2442)
MQKILSAIANDDFTLDLKFDDGSLRKFDVKPYLEYGIFKELKDQHYFKKVRVAFGTVQWPNEQDFSPETLYVESRIVEPGYA